MKKILLTGANGFLGCKVAESLAKKNFQVICFDIASDKIKSNKNLKVYIGSILNRYDLDNAIKSCNVVIHLAAMVGVELTEKKRLECLEVNINGTKNVLEAAVKKKVNKFLFSSSSEVYGDQDKIPIKEDANLIPKSNYGITKLVSEEYVKSYSKFYNFDYNIFRFFNLYGENQRKEFVIPKFINQIKKNKPINIYGKGNQIRSYCHIDDAVEAIINVMRKGKPNETYNIGNNNNPISVKDLANKIVKISGKNFFNIKHISFDKSDRLEKREIFKRQPDISKIKKDTNYKPLVNLNSGIKKFFKK